MDDPFQLLLFQYPGGFPLAEPIDHYLFFASARKRNGILSNPCAIASIRLLLAHQPGQQLPALPTCTDQ